MGKGLSSQQQRILGLGRAFNIAFHGEPRFPELTVVEPGDPASIWPYPAVVAPDGLPEIKTQLCLLVLDGMKLVREVERRGYVRKDGVGIWATKIMFDQSCGRGEYFDGRQPGFAVRKASMTRAVAGLLKRRLLVFQSPGRMRATNDRASDGGLIWVDVATFPTADSGGVWGYRLTPEGARAGEGHEPDVAAVELLKARQRLLWNQEAGARRWLDERIASLEQVAA